MKDATRRKTTRDTILDATDRLLSRFGYKKMTIDDLAREVGIGKGSVYLYFASKEEIALSHIDRIIERLKARLRQVTSDAGPIDERLREMLCQRVLFRFDSVQHYSQSLDDLMSSVRAKLLERRRKYFEEEAHIFGAVIEEGQRSGHFISGDPVDMARTLLSATNSLLPYSLSVAELGARSNIEARIQKTADILIRGISI